MPPATQSRTLLVSLLGAFARRTDEWLPISGIVSLMSEVDLDESSVRTGVSRLKKRGWLLAEKRGKVNGYRLTDLARESLAAGDRIIWHARQPADLRDGWCIANFSVPESDRSRRHLLRSRLATLGFGNIGPGVWIAPARMHEAAVGVIESLDLSDNTVLFVGSHAGGQDLVKMTNASWDLPEINGQYLSFIAAHQHDLQRFTGVEPGDIPTQAAFVIYLRVIDDWRKLPFRDPGLPRELLGEDWAGDDAGRLFESIIDRLDLAAIAHVRLHFDG
jgi:phenylacetic acid degradation operon negative regulatory protein